MNNLNKLQTILIALTSIGSIIFLVDIIVFIAAHWQNSI